MLREEEWRREMAKKMVETLEENVKETKEEKTTEKKTPAKKAAAKKTTKKDEIKEEVKEETENSDADDAEAQEAKFWEKIEGILAIAKKKKNVLDYQEIMTYFQDTDFEADRMEKVFEILELKKVDVRMNDVPDEDEDIILDDEDEIDIEKIDLSVPDGIGLDDPVRMYLKVKYLFLVLMKRLNMPREWKKEMRKPRKDLQKLT